MKLDTSSYYPKSPLDDEPETASSVGTPQNAEPESEKDSGFETTETKTGDNVSAQDKSPLIDRAPLPDNSPITKISHALSWLLVPMLMPVYGVMLAFGLSILSFTGFGVRAVFTAVVFAFNVAIPAVIVLILKRIGIVHDVGLNEREERFIPYLVCILCLVGTALFFGHKLAPRWLVMFFYGGALAGLVEVIVNRWWKISVHAAGIAGIVALLLHIQSEEYCSPATGTWLLISIALAGLLGSARIWLGRHTLGQVLAGYAVGFCGVFFAISLFS